MILMFEMCRLCGTPLLLHEGVPSFSSWTISVDISASMRGHMKLEETVQSVYESKEGVYYEREEGSGRGEREWSVCVYIMRRLFSLCVCGRRVCVMRGEREGKRERKEYEVCVYIMLDCNAYFMPENTLHIHVHARVTNRYCYSISTDEHCIR